MIHIDPRDKRPLYEQIIQKLTDIMLYGGLGADDRLPSVRQLASLLSINPNTIQRAYLELERQGYIYSVKGKGSFVADTSSIRKGKTEDFFQELHRLIQRAVTLKIPLNDIIAGIESSYHIAGREVGAGDQFH